MIRVFVRHTVTNYAQWRVVYDEFDHERQRMGVVDEAIHQDLTDPNAITVTHDFEDAALAISFAESTRLREVLAEAGVVDTPVIWMAQTAWAIPRGLWPHYWGHEYEPDFAQPAYWST